jgi:hypothetical protein
MIKKLYKLMKKKFVLVENIINEDNLNNCEKKSKK